MPALHTSIGGITQFRRGKHRCALGVCSHAAPTIFNRTKTMNTKELIRLGVPMGELIPP